MLRVFQVAALAGCTTLLLHGCGGGGGGDDDDYETETGESHSYDCGGECKVRVYCSKIDGIMRAEPKAGCPGKKEQPITVNCLASCNLNVTDEEDDNYCSPCVLLGGPNCTVGPPQTDEGEVMCGACRIGNGIEVTEKKCKIEPERVERV